MNSTLLHCLFEFRKYKLLTNNEFDTVALSV